MGYPRALRAELHKALSDAGIEYWVTQGITVWNCDDGRECLAYGYECSDGTPRIAVKVVGIRDPQQAIEMTVGMTDERIVRCRDCKYEFEEWGYPYCCRIPMKSFEVDGDSFCSFGVPRRVSQ